MSIEIIKGKDSKKIEIWHNNNLFKTINLDNQEQIITALQIAYALGKIDGGNKNEKIY